VDAKPPVGKPATGHAGLRRLGSGAQPTAPGVSSPPAPTTDAGRRRPLTLADAAVLKDAKVVLGDRTLPDDARPEVISDALMVSLKPIFEAFDGALYWFPGDRVGRGVTANSDLAVQIGSSRATLNGAGIEVQPAPVLKNGRILAPIDLVGKALSVTFMLDAEAKTITIER